MLIDEYGILKLSDFKFVKKIPKSVTPSDLNTAIQLPANTLPYTAPEILSNSGVVSFASDFWGLGCVLFQLRRGQLPFHNGDGDSNTSASHTKPGSASNRSPSKALLSNTPEALVKRIISSENPFSRDSMMDSAVSDIPSVTTEFYDLVSWLLECSPIHRVTWYYLKSYFVL